MFFVRGQPGREAKIAFLAPTATYIAYANQRVLNRGPLYEAMVGSIIVLGPEDITLQSHPELGDGLYGSHSDGSGICYSSRLRPILNMRPNTMLYGFSGDGYILSWLDKLGYDVDIITDEDLEHEGYAAIKRYSVLITGCHPEYASTGMLDALVEFSNCGGRLMYLGGNGFYWRIAFSPHHPGSD